jgi:hypothetical protein
MATRTVIRSRKKPKMEKFRIFMEMVRTLVPMAILLIQVAIYAKVY